MRSSAIFARNPFRMRSYEKRWGRSAARFRLSPGGAEELGDGDEAEAFATPGFEDVRQGLKAAGGVGDAVVKDDNRSGDEILIDQPADVPYRRMHRIVGVGAAKNADIAARLG